MFECSKYINEIIKNQHAGDDKQLEVIFSTCNRVIVEAPAGYGKTTTMISRIAYLFSTNQIVTPKKILGLTFSVNAALKVKREVASKLPELLEKQDSPLPIGEKVYVTNYHGFCKRVLKKYGYLLSDSLLKDINLFHALGEKEIDKNSCLSDVVTYDELNKLKNVDNKIKSIVLPSSQDIYLYNQIVIKKLLPLGYITHNAVILLVIELFSKYPQIQNFYQNYFNFIVVDEFQDTNCIAWKLLDDLINTDTKLLFLGDSLQRIYGFIGAIPDIMTIAEQKYNMKRIELTRNYRFKDNQDMLKLDRNIRLNANNCLDIKISEEEIAMLPLIWSSNKKGEMGKVVTKVRDILKESDTRVAFLFKNRSSTVDLVEEALEKSGIDYFYGMFTDENQDYVYFHNVCQSLFISNFGSSKNVSKNKLLNFLDKVHKHFSESQDKVYGSLLQLLHAFVMKINIDYSDLSPEDKYQFIIDVFENRQLKQAMEYIDSRVILSTIHGAKGLEWDYVIIMDIERWVYSYVCKDCANRFNQYEYFCRMPDNMAEEVKKQLLNDLCVFYVGLTRAKKQVFIAACGERINSKGIRYDDGKVFCLATVSGVRPYSI